MKKKAKPALPAWASPNFNQPKKGFKSVDHTKRNSKGWVRGVNTSISTGYGATQTFKVK